MSISRRRFFRYAASFTPTALAMGMPGTLRATTIGRNRCLILEDSCALKESLEGYAAGLKAAGMAFEIAPRAAAKPAPVIIVPATSLIDFQEVHWLRTEIEAGSLVLVESGGAFLSASEFQSQQLLVSSQFNLTLPKPVKLWETPGSARRIPYVDLTWPVPARVRDFGQMIPLNQEGPAAVARIEECVVGVKRRLGAGTLVFLSTPLGPHLLAGDREAQCWLEAFCDQGLG